VFECNDLGPHILKGVSTPVPVYRVLTESGAQSSLEVAGPSGMTRLVGREQEVGLLLERWGQAKDGLGQVVLLSGEAGIGKSRLVQVVKESVAGEPHVLWEGRCSAYYQNSALYPVIDLMQRVLRLTREDSRDAKLRKLEEALAVFPLSLSDVVPLLAALLSLPLPDRYPPLTMTPQRQKQKTLEAVLALLHALAVRQPVLFIMEDLHWVDPSTLELLGLLIDQVPTARIFTLLIFRPEFRPPWVLRAHLTSLTLSRLPRPQVEVMVERVAGDKALPAEVCQQIVAKTDGIPLFVEELTKMVLESGLLRERESYYELTGPLPPLAIPATLHDSLMARLDRLATGKGVAQLGATLGRAFSYELLRAISPMEEAKLQCELGHLVEAELLYQQGVPPQATYLFKHALIQATAYQSLLKRTRLQYHQRIAQVLEARFPETTETQPELLAHHFTEAGLHKHAIGYWQRAGQRAIQRSGHVEAISHLTKGLEVLKTLPDTPERSQQELTLQITLGAPLTATKGYAAPEVERVYARARELCQQLGETPQLFRVLWGLLSFYAVRADLRTANELGMQMLRLAQRVEHSAFLVEAHRAVGATLFWLGQLTEARAHLEQMIPLYNPQQHRSHAFLYGQDPAVSGRCYAALALWNLGYPDQALQRSREAVALAGELAHPFTLAYALSFAAVVHQLRGEVQEARERAEAAIALSREQGFPQWVGMGMILSGWALAAQGRRAEGLAQMRQGLTPYRATGARVARTYWLALLAEAHENLGQAEEGLSLLAEAFEAVQQCEERNYEPELYRLKGELVLALSREDHTEAEGCFRQALDVACRQQAKSLELRAAVGLSRLWQQQGKRDEARELLTPIYGWFTEGFDTADLQEAKALLEELSR
jgi:predicted ATPase